MVGDDKRGGINSLLSLKLDLKKCNCSQSYSMIDFQWGDPLLYVNRQGLY